MKPGLDMALQYNRDALKQMMVHAACALKLLPEDDDTRLKWNAFWCGCEDMMQLMTRAEMVAEYLKGIVDLMERYGLQDWSYAAQVYAMEIGKDERVVMAMVLEEFEK